MWRRALFCMVNPIPHSSVGEMWRYWFLRLLRCRCISSLLIMSLLWKAHCWQEDSSKMTFSKTKAILRETRYSLGLSKYPLKRMEFPIRTRKGKGPVENVRTLFLMDSLKGILFTCCSLSLLAYSSQRLIRLVVQEELIPDKKECGRLPVKPCALPIWRNPPVDLQYAFTSS